MKGRIMGTPCLRTRAPMDESATHCISQHGHRCGRSHLHLDLLAVSHVLLALHPAHESDPHCRTDSTAISAARTV